jgi:hypothetical protein
MPSNLRERPSEPLLLLPEPAAARTTKPMGLAGTKMGLAEPAAMKIGLMEPVGRKLKPMLLVMRRIGLLRSARGE